MDVATKTSNSTTDVVSLSLEMTEDAYAHSQPNGLVVTVNGIGPDRVIENATYLHGLTKLTEFRGLTFETALTELFYSFKNLYRVKYNIDVVITPYQVKNEDGTVGTKCRFWYNTGLDAKRCEFAYQRIVVRDPYEDHVLDCFMNPAKASVHYMTPAEYSRAPKSQKEGTKRSKHDPRVLLRKAPCIGGHEAIEAYNRLVEDFFQALSEFCATIHEERVPEIRVFRNSTGLKSPLRVAADYIALSHVAAEVANGLNMQGGGYN